MKRIREVLLFSLCVVLTLTSAAARAADEAIVYGIANFGGTGQCGTTSMTHSVHTTTAAEFKNSFDVRKLVGLWDYTYTRNNSSARGRYFTDASKDPVGTDSLSGYGVDSADVIYVHTHGNHSTSPAYSSLSMGNSVDGLCSVRTDDHMLFGNGGAGGDLDIAVIKACQSADYDTWLNGGYGGQFASWNSQFTLWNGFHGDSSCGTNVTAYVGFYVSNSFLNGVGDNWLDAAYEDEGSGNDDCPVSIVLGASSTARRDMYDNGGFSDRKNTGDMTGSTYFYIEGCNPDNGRALPN